MQTVLIAGTIVFSVGLNSSMLAADCAGPEKTETVELVLEKAVDVSTEGNVRFAKAKISVSDDDSAILVDQSSGDNVLIPVNVDDERRQYFRVDGWNAPSLVAQSTKVVAKTWDRAILTDPLRTAGTELLSVRHHMEEGDWIDPVISPRGDILATRPAINEVRFWDLKTLEPLTDSIPLPGRVSGISFTSDGKYFRVYAQRRLRILNPRTGEQVAEPRQNGRFRYYPSSPGTYSFARPRAAYEPSMERIVYFKNSGEDDNLTCRAVIRSLSGKAEPVYFKFDLHAFQASWIDPDHLLIQAGRILQTNWYRTNPLLVVSLKGDTTTVTEIHANVNHFGIAPDRQHIVATVTERGGRNCVCWKVGMPEPLWTEFGGYASFGGDGSWVLTHNQGGTLRLRAIHTGSVLWEQPNVQVALAKGSNVWAFFDERFQLWNAK